ncbi:hypothetical protein B0F90DRAFT_412010 [Multifurca ochricompacta]|uniref:BTB domain-containing protein n=1 Tax=Multifurca ochricompacta TaxID=376703 RepID=A0AAD4QNA4_9AGAM|nr:hypothetical protein B0F90DRAFT_412010 [Multifurca ochricompacta]
MPLNTTPRRTSSTLSRHPDYFFPEADVTFEVDNVLFRAHKRFFIRESAYFRALFTAPPIPCQDPPGSETNPVVLEHTSVDGFAGLLWVFYNPRYSIYNTTVEKWQSILTLAQRWGFKEVEELCVRELEKLPIPPVEKIYIYQKFKLNASLLLESYAKLTNRAEPIDLEEGRKLGIDTSLLIARARELSRGTGSHTSPRSPSAIQLESKDLQRLIREVFGLGELLNGSAQPMVTPIPSHHMGNY